MLHRRIFPRAGADAPDPNAEWVVFVHGAGGSSAIWFRQVRAFQDAHNVLMVDLRGHGGSQLDEDVARRLTYSFDAVAREVVAVLDEEGVGAAHFVGISLGTIVIRQIGEVVPARVRSMTMGGAVVRLNLRSRFLVGVGTAVRRFVPFLWLYKLLAWIIMPRRRHRTSRLLFVREAERVARREFLRWWKLTAEVNPLLRLFRERDPDIPTLYVMGAEDHLFLPTVRRVAEAHEAELAVVEDSGHVVNLDQPEVFNRLVLDFLARIAPRPALAAG